jgi:hypothetical protein
MPLLPATLAAIVAMFALLGPIGNVSAIPLAAVVQTLLNRLVFPPEPPLHTAIQRVDALLTQAEVRLGHRSEEQ